MTHSSFRWRLLVTLALASAASGCSRSPYDGTVIAKERVAIRGHYNRIRSLSFSPDGAWLVSGSEDGTIKTWDTTTWKLTSTVEETDKTPPPVLSVVYSPDGKMLAAGKGNGMTKIYDAAGKELMTCRAKDQWIRSVAFSPDGKQVASAEDDGSVILWDVATGKANKTLKASKEAVWAVSFSPDGQLLATGGWEDIVVRIWDVKSGSRLQTLHGVQGIVRSLAFLPDSKTVATGGDFVWLHDAATGSEKTLLRGHVTNSTAIAISTDGKTLVSAGQAGEVKVWDTASGKVRATYWGNPREEVWSIALSPDGKTIASGTAKGTIMIWDMIN